MKGSAKVIAALNEALQEEFMAINQYFLHAEMCENWKYEALGQVHQEAVHRRDEACRKAASSASSSSMARPTSPDRCSSASAKR